MKIFWVEGLYRAAGGRKKSKSSSAPEAGTTQAFYRSFYANSPTEALSMATEAIAGGQWLEGPKICKKSEEERLRSQGAAELPLFAAAKPPKKRR